MEQKFNEIIFPNIKNESIEAEYNRTGANYLIEDNKFRTSDLCCIYFCSNALFYPETEENFDNVIIKQNFFEWYHTRLGIESRSIFVRDISKNFYVTGINSEIDSLDKLCDWLEEQTRGYRVITVGSSAGGYAALAAGIRLKAIKIYDFSGQIDLWHYFDFCNKPLLLKYQDDNTRNKYYNLVELVRNADETTIIIYVTPAKCSQDIQQVSELLKADNKNVNIIRIKSRRHGVPLFKESIPMFFDLSDKDIEVLTLHENSLMAYTAKYGGGISVYIRGMMKLAWQYAGRIASRIKK